MIISENVIVWYREKTRSKDWAKWATDNPKKDALLAAAMAADRELING